MSHKDRNDKDVKAKFEDILNHDELLQSLEKEYRTKAPRAGAAVGLVIIAGLVMVSTIVGSLIMLGSSSSGAAWIAAILLLTVGTLVTLALGARAVSYWVHTEQQLRDAGVKTRRFIALRRKGK